MPRWRSASLQTARALKSQLGIGRGDRVALLATNHPDCLVLLYACARLGAMLVPLNWRLAVAEQMYILADASVKALVVEQGLAAVAAALTNARPEVRIVGLDFRAAPAGRRCRRCLKRRAATAAFRTSIPRFPC